MGHCSNNNRIGRGVGAERVNISIIMLCRIVPCVELFAILTKNDFKNIVLTNVMYT